MKFKVLSTAIAVLSLGVAPALAAAQPVATPLTQSAALTQPASEQIDGDSALQGRRGGGTFLIAGLAFILIGVAIYIAVHNRHDRPNSP